jgi:hypothetical protein
MNKKKLFFLILFVGISFSFTKKAQSGPVWTGIFENDQITIEVSENRCINTKQGTDNIYLFFKVTNKTAEKINVSFLKEVWYNEKCFSCDHPAEYTSTITLEPNGVMEGSCENLNSPLKIFKSMPSGFSKNVLTNYELKNIVVKTVD